MTVQTAVSIMRTVSVIWGKAGQRLRALRHLLFPDWLFVAGLPPRTARSIVIRHTPIGDEEKSQLRACGRGRQPVDLVLASDIMLEKRISLPRAIRREAEAAISVRLRQQMPAGGAGLLWAVVPDGHDGDAIVYRALIVKRAEMSDLIDEVRRMGFMPRRVIAAGAAEARPFVDLRHDTDRPQRLWTLIAACVLVGTLAWSGFGQWRELSALAAQAAALELETAQLREQAVAARAQATTRDQSVAEIATELGIFNLEYRRFPILADLTERLGENVHLEALQIDRDELWLAGQSAIDVASLVEALGDAPWARHAQIDGPVSVDPATGQSLFELLVVLEQAEGGT